jgi:hypothetical protein
MKNSIFELGFLIGTDSTLPLQHTRHRGRTALDSIDIKQPKIKKAFPNVNRLTSGLTNGQKDVIFYSSSLIKILLLKIR